MTIDITAVGPRRGRARAQRPGASPDTTAAVSLRGVNVSFAKHQVVRDVTLDLVRNRVTALVGPSGCGRPRFSEPSTVSTTTPAAR